MQPFQKSHAQIWMGNTILDNSLKSSLITIILASELSKQNDGNGKDFSNFKRV